MAVVPHIIVAYRRNVRSDNKLKIMLAIARSGIINLVFGALMLNTREPSCRRFVAWST